MAILTLKEITETIGTRKTDWSKYSEDYDSFLFEIDASILKAKVDSKKEAIISFDFDTDFDCWTINEVWCSEYKDFDQLIAIVKNYLLFNGFSKEDIELYDTEMHIKL